mmetsp:Transcript_15339/g.27271  ORF Transcript_15339/g.27271 Transcript_15339/m.27271 type:complete len:353 (+) Transcript_15339:106-1164(+)
MFRDQQGVVAYPTWALVVGSIVSSVALVVVNKQIFDQGFGYVFTLSTFHFLVTWALLQVMARCAGAFEVKRLPFRINIMVAAFGVGSICLMNFSLESNSIGFYQMTKLCIVPCCLGINFVVHGETATRKILGALFMILVGVGIATVTDVELNTVGTIYGVAAVLVTAQYQIWQGKKQKEYDLSSMQLANSVSFFQIFIGLLLALKFEASKILDLSQENSMPSSLIFLILLSGLLAMSVNIHSFALIGKTSAVTFQVVGHGKTCLILLSGYFLHIQAGKPVAALYTNVFGVTVALAGVVLYSNLKLTPPGKADSCDMLLPRKLLQIFCPNEISSLPVSSEDSMEAVPLKSVED